MWVCQATDLHSPHWRCTAVGECAGLLFSSSSSLPLLLSWWPPSPLGVSWFKHGPPTYRCCCVSSLHSCAHFKHFSLMLLGSLMYTHPFTVLHWQHHSSSCLPRLLHLHYKWQFRGCLGPADNLHSQWLPCLFDPTSESRDVYRRSESLGCVWLVWEE